MLKPVTLLLCLVSALAFAQSNAENYISPDNIEGSRVINAETLIDLASENEKLVIVDSRIVSDRRQGYIAGSVSLPDTETSCDSLSTIIPGKETATVFYCNGPKCRRSDRAVYIALECGYKNVYWFRGGYQEWKNKNYLISK